MSEYVLDLGGPVTPQAKGGKPRVGIGFTVVCKTDSAGAINAGIFRGDGGNPETFAHLVRAKFFEAPPGSLLTIEFGCIDLTLPDFTPRRYRLRLVADAGATIQIIKSLIVTRPFAPAGAGP